MILVLIALVIVCMTVGWVAGMWTRQRTRVWCDVCGQGLKCLNCERLPVSVVPLDGAHPQATAVGVEEAR